jgi:formiminotetrahydrofolate cyclodeaminase
MRVATEVPLETIQACVDAMRAGQPVQTHGNPAAASDATVGYRLLLAAAQSAQDNVEINLDGLAGTDLRARLRAAAAQLVREALEMHAAAVLT